MAEQELPDMGMSREDLYTEETFTDRRAGTIRRMTPVTASGEVDDGRPVLYVGETQLMTSAGALPLSFELEADSLDEAVAKFGEAARAALEQTMERLQEMRREAASSLYVPGQGDGGMGGPRGRQGGGGLQMP